LFFWPTNEHLILWRVEYWLQPLTNPCHRGTEVQAPRDALSLVQPKCQKRGAQFEERTFDSNHSADGTFSVKEYDKARNVPDEFSDGCPPVTDLRRTWIVVRHKSPLIF
jgi:hypothetical protein